MKSKLIILVLLLSKFCSAQINQTEVVNKTTSVPCNPNTFWGVRFDPNNFNTTIVSEYSLINSVVTPTGYNIYNCPGISIAYSNSLVPSIIGNTIYSYDFLVGNTLYGFDGTNWITIVNGNPYYLYHGAGYQNKLVLDGNLYPFQETFRKRLFSFNGIGFDTIYSTSNNISISVWDLAIDELYNVWYFEAYDSLISNPFCLNSFNLFTGLKKVYPIKQNSLFSSVEAYGMFIMNNILYVGIGSSNSIYPNKLLPFTIINDSVLLGNPIAFGGDLYDLESCNQGTLTSVKEVPASFKQLSVYPNPATDQFSVYIPYGTNANAHIIVTNLQGAILEDRLVKDNKIPINCEQWTAGMYLVSVVSIDRGIVTAKVLKQ
jgi:hypothetical protein